MIDAIRRLLLRVDSFQRAHGALSFPLAVVRKMSDDGGGSLAAQIGYYGFLSVFPLLLAFAAVLGFVLVGHPALKDHVIHTTEQSFPALSSYIDKKTNGNGVALGLGLVGALWAGLGVTRATERAMNNVWDVPMTERPNLWWSRVRGLAMLGVLGTTFVLSTALAAVRGIGGSLRPLSEVIGIVGPLALNFALYLLAFQVLTNRHIGWRRLAPGAAFGAVGWTLLQGLGAFFVRHEISHASRLYGSLATVVALLVWIYLGAQLTLYAAEINVVLVHRLWPRSLTRSHDRTDADRHALALQAREAQRVAGEVVTVAIYATERAFDGTVSASPGATGDEHGEYPTADNVIVHLQAMSVCRRSLREAPDEKARQELLSSLRLETADAAVALRELLRQDVDLAAAFAGAPDTQN